MCVFLYGFTAVGITIMWVAIYYAICCWPQPAGRWPLTRWTIEQVGLLLVRCWLWSSQTNMAPPPLAYVIGKWQFIRYAPRFDVWYCIALNQIQIANRRVGRLRSTTLPKWNFAPLVSGMQHHHDDAFGYNDKSNGWYIKVGGVKIKNNNKNHLPQQHRHASSYLWR